MPTKKTYSLKDQAQQEVDYYKALIKADRERLKNTTGAEVEHLYANIAYNTKQKNKANYKLILLSR